MDRKKSELFLLAAQCKALDEFLAAQLINHSTGSYHRISQHNFIISSDTKLEPNHCDCCFQCGIKRNNCKEEFNCFDEVELCSSCLWLYEHRNMKHKQLKELVDITVIK